MARTRSPSTKPAKEARKSRPIRMTDAEWERCKALGGAAFVRSKIKAAKVGHNVDVSRNQQGVRDE